MKKKQKKRMKKWENNFNERETRVKNEKVGKRKNNCNKRKNEKRRQT